MNDLNILIKSPDTSIAVIGATDHTHKYGYIIYKHLKAKGYKVYPVNPTRDSVDGDRCYPALSGLPERPTIINFVTPPEITIKVLEECHRLQWSNVWIQPGAENARVIAFLQKHPFNYLVHSCIMVLSKKFNK